MDVHNVNQLVLHKQHLARDARIDDVVQVTADISGLHATGPINPYLSLLARCQSFRKERLDRELYENRSLGRIRCVRKTIYILPKEMVPYAYQATATMVQGTSRRYLERRGVSAEEYERASDLILALVSDDGMTASAIKKALHTDLDLSAILYLMCDQGRLARGKPERGWKDQQHRYFPFTEYFPDVDLDSVGEAEAIVFMLHRYLASFGPATENDIVWWLGLGKRKAQAALRHLQEQTVQVSITGLEGEFTMLQADQEQAEHLTGPQKPTISFLPSLDPYLMGYKERARYLDHRHYDLVFDRSGNATSTILLDGRVIGVWDFEGDRDPVVKLYTFEPVEEDLRQRMLTQALRTGGFMAGQDVQIRMCDTMLPLPQRPAGSIMAPLKGA